MTQTLVAAAVEVKCNAITGVKKTRRAMPKAFPSTSTPFFVMELGNATPAPRTMGSAGAVEMRYPIRLRLILAASDIDPELVTARLLLFAERVRAAFSADHTLGGTCFDAELTEGRDNVLNTEWRAGTGPPELTWTLQVKEWTAANASAA